MIVQQSILFDKISMEPIYMPGRLRTASRPFRTWISLALYSWSVAVSALVLVMISSAISFLPFCFSCRYRVVSLFWKRSGRHFPRLQAAGFSQGAAAQRSFDHLFGAAAQHGAGQL